MKYRCIVIGLGILLFTLMGLFSCDDCGPFANRYKTTGLDWFLYNGSYSDTADSKITLKEVKNDTAEAGKFMIFMILQQETYYAKSNTAFQLPFVNNVYACSPVMPITIETVDSIVITSFTDFNTHYPAGSNLADFFDLVVYDHQENSNYQKYTIKEYTEANSFVPIEMFLLLKSHPEDTDGFEFNVKFYLKGIDYNFFEFTTSEVVIPAE